MQFILNDPESQAPVILHPEPMTDDEFFDFCQLYPNFRIERTAEGEIVIMPPAGFETGYRNNELARQLGNWTLQNGRGRAFDSNTEYILPSGARPLTGRLLGREIPDCYVDRQAEEKFPRLCPEFVVELMSPSDRLKRVQKKMREWIENGVLLGWLLDADKRTAYIYRPGREPEILVEPQRLVGEGPVAGFVLELDSIWSNL